MLSCMNSKPVNIEVVSDFACPWCFVGKRRLEKAIEQLPELIITVEWRPFQLNPKMPREGRNRQEYYREKFGEERLNDLRVNLDNAGAGEGIIFCDDPGAMAPNTLSAHMLMFWASIVENVDSNALAEKLLHAHHVTCENIGDIDVLARIAGEVGMDKAGVVAKYAAGDDECMVKEQINQAAVQGISGVPFFIFNNEYGLSGAQPAETMVSAILAATKPH